VCIWQHAKTGERIAVLIQDDWLEGVFGPLDPDTEDKIKITGLAKDAWRKEMTQANTRRSTAVLTHKAR